MAIFRISLISKMIHSQKTYHLAHPLSSSEINNMQHSLHLKSASADVNVHRLTTVKANIFENNYQYPSRWVEPKNEKEYQYVGYKQMKSVKSRGEKRKKTINYFSKKTYDNLFQMTRSFNKKGSTEEGVLTKQQVIEYFSPAFKKQDSFIHSPQYSMESNLKNKNLVEMRISSNRVGKSHFSIGKLKQKLDDYKSIWKNHSKQKQKKKNPSSNKENQSKYVSLMDSIDYYRDISKRKTQFDLKEKLLNVKPDHWQALLRTTDSFEHLYTKGNYHIETDGFKSSGRNKLLKELSWINKKDKQGFFFKSTKLHDQILLSS